MKNKYALCLLGLVLVVNSCKKININKKNDNYLLTKYVNPFIGTGGHGHTYPGATVPFGMLQVSPDNGISKWDWCSGYNYSDSITIGFSHLHLSGTGIGDLCDIRFMPINKKVDLTKVINTRDDIPYKSKYSHDNESSKAGYYSVYLKDYNIKAEFTTSLRTAFHRYTYKKNEAQSIIIDLGYPINWDKTIGSQIEIVDKNTISGYRFSTGWAKNQKVFFVAKFSKPITNYDLVKDGNYITDNKSVKGVKTFAQLYFNTLNNEKIQVKVGVSSVSVANAIQNIAQQNGSFKFNEAKEKAEKEWDKSLSKIIIETPNDSLKTIFYTALYHSLIAPVTFSDVNGEFRLGNDSIVKANNFTAYSTLSLWDTFRAEQPLLTILEPKKVSDIINSMLVYYENKKALPVWVLYGNETNTMTGYHSIPVIAEAYIKGIKGFDIDKAYEEMKSTMMLDKRGLKYYKKYGYIPYNLLDESVTITIEYAYDDWCVAQIAKELGKDEDYKYFLKRSKAYQYLYDKGTGFMRGKSEIGSWHKPFDPKYSSHRIHTDYTEANAWQSSWFVLQDIKKLIKLHGGDDKFSNKLEQLFTEPSDITGKNISSDISGLIGQYAHGNEPSHHIAYMFNFANKPWKTQYWVRQILKTQYKGTPAGLSGNEDCGQMSAWYVFSSIGLYPFNPVSGQYQIGSPLFKKTTIRISETKSFIILADNTSDENIYIQSATLNGNKLNRTFITHKELIQGGVLHFIMGSKPNKKWGIKK